MKYEMEIIGPKGRRKGGTKTRKVKQEDVSNYSEGSGLEVGGVRDERGQVRASVR